MPINIYSVANHLTENGWELLATEYKNLDTELEMKCPEGHYQKQTYKQWRKHPICEICMAGDPYKIKKNKVPIKKIDTCRILALDAATNITGYSIYDDDVLVNYGTYKTNENHDATERINEVKKWLVAMIENVNPNFVGIEGIQLQQFGKNYNVELYRVLANLQGVLLDTLFELQVPCGLVYSSTWRNYCNVGDDRGRENKKKAAQEKVFQWYQQKCTQDEADAICIGKYFCYYIKNQSKPSTWGEEI